MMSALLILVSLALASLEEANYSVDQLEVLANKAEFHEAVFRLGDIPPGQRDARWEKVAERVAIGHMKLLRQEGMAGADAVAVELVKVYPSLRRSTEAVALRNELVLTATERCYATAEAADCTKRLFEFIESEKAPAIEAAKLVAAKHAPIAALPFFTLALSPLNVASLCQEPLLQAAVKAALAEPAGALRDNGMRLAGRECWQSMRAEIEQEIDLSPAGKAALGACQVLNAHKLLSPARLEKCKLSK